MMISFGLLIIEKCIFSTQFYTRDPIRVTLIFIGFTYMTDKYIITLVL